MVNNQTIDFFNIIGKARRLQAVGTEASGRSSASALTSSGNRPDRLGGKRVARQRGGEKTVDGSRTNASRIASEDVGT
jgi:hypothetical protein